MRRCLPVAAVLAALVAVLLAAGPARAGEPAYSGRHPVVLVGVPGLRWDDVDAVRTPTLWRLARHGSLGTLSVRAARSITCPADGWLTLGAGNRARGPAHTGGRCPSGEPGPSGNRQPDMAGYAADNHRLDFDAEPGDTAPTLAHRGDCVSATGPGAALAAAHPNGRLDAYAPRLPAAPASVSALLARCPVSMVELVDLERGSGDRADRAARVDAALASVDAARPAGSVLLVAGVSETSGSPPRLHLLIAQGPGFTGGWLRSASTRREPYVQLIDLAPTVIALRGANPPDQMVGQRITVAGGRPAATAAAVHHLVDLDMAARAHRMLVPQFYAVTVLAQVLLYGAAAALLFLVRPPPGAARRVRGATSLVALGFAALPAGTFLANLVPWWRADHLLITLLGCTFVAAAAIVAAAVAGPWRRAFLGPATVVAGVTFGLLGLDVAIGAPLQMDSLAGYSPLVAGRFAGFGNTAFAIFGTGAVLLAAGLIATGRVAGSRLRVLAVVGLVGVAAIVLDGAPAFGSDFGGVLALVPAFGLLALRAGRFRVSLVRLGLVALAAVAAVSAFAVADYLRPPDSRSHLGRFVAQVVNGDAATIIRRKLHANLNLLTHSVLTLLVPVAVAFLALLLFRPRGGLRQAIERSPQFEAGLLAVLALQLVGFAANDSGVAIPALSMTVVVPLALAVAIRATEDPADPVGAPIGDAVSHKSGDRLIR